MPFNLGRVSEYSATGKVHNMTKYLQQFFENYSKLRLSLT